MKSIGIFILCTSAILLLSTCGGETNESKTKTIENPVDTYLDSRVDAIDMAKGSVKESSKRSKEQEEAMRNFTK